MCKYTAFRCLIRPCADLASHLSGGECEKHAKPCEQVFHLCYLSVFIWYDDCHAHEAQLFFCCGDLCGERSNARCRISPGTFPNVTSLESLRMRCACTTNVRISRIFRLGPAVKRSFSRWRLSNLRFVSNSPTPAPSIALVTRRVELTRLAEWNTLLACYTDLNSCPLLRLKPICMTATRFYFASSSHKRQL